MKMTLPALVAATAITVFIPAMASAAPGLGQAIDEREANIAQRIDDGEHGGGLTRSEAASLRQTLRGIERTEAQDMRHGLNNDEQAHLNKRLDQLSDQVDHKRHNDVHR